MNMTRIIAASENGDAAALAIFVNILQNVNIAKYTLVATFMLFIYDFLLTLDEEIFLIWSSRWGVPKALFFLNRYFPFVDLILLLYVLMIGSDPSSCVKLFQIAGGTVAFGFVVAQVILTMRTWAIWGRQTWVTVLLSILVLAALVVDVFVLTRYLGGISYASLGALQPAYSGCPLQFSNRIVFVDFVIVMVTESVMLALLVIKALEHFQHSRSTLMVRMFKDGVIYFIFILCTSIANLVTVLSAPVELHEFLIITQRILHSILCSHVLLHIRGAYTNTPYFSTTTADSHVRSNSTSAYYAFRRPLSGPGVCPGEAFELGTVGTGVSVISGEVQMHGIADDVVGWGMGHGFDVTPSSSPKQQEWSRQEWRREDEGSDDDKGPPSLSAVSSTISPLAELGELRYDHRSHPHSYSHSMANLDV